MDFLYANIFNQCLANCLSNLIMHLYFLVQNPLLKYSLWMIWNIWPFWIMFCFIFICIIIKVNHFIFKCFSSSVLHTFPALDIILSKVCNLLSSLLFSAILLIISLYTLCASLLNFFHDFNMISLLKSNFL